jgi:four helix bundle protein
MRWKTSLLDRTFAFGSATIRLSPQISARGPEFGHIAKQLFRAATSIGANLEEGQVAMSRRDMGLKHAIALREAREAVYWIRMLIEANVLVAELAPLRQEGNEIVAMLTTSVKKLRMDKSEV